ncbi:hypothetical protein ABEW32_20515 [Paenibacillus jamilae]|uniref:hypothetical protein n=1 Tax=Paenibacillus jamilae TaxID=114136 RepID=UPI003D2920B7
MEAKKKEWYIFSSYWLGEDIKVFHFSKRDLNSEHQLVSIKIAVSTHYQEQEEQAWAILFDCLQ